MARYRLYWQPGCTSCLKAKEFLAAHGIPFDSINVRAAPDAMAELAALGVRSVPVVVQGDRFCFGQELEEVARFVGVPWRRARLPVPVLVQRLDNLLAAASALAAQIASDDAEVPLPGRPDRTYGDIGYHIAMIVEGFLAAAAGDTLVFAFFERRAEGEGRAPRRVAAQIDATGARFAAWWAANRALDPATPLRTYYGTQPLHGVLERTAWHVAQHCRQLEHVVASLGMRPEATLGEAALGGLPLPEGVWDREVAG